MRLGLHIGNFSWPGGPADVGPTLVEIAQAADESGFYSLTVMDHFFQLGPQFGEIHGRLDEPMLEAYSTIAYLAGKTRRIRLGVGVTCASYRPPGLLVKAITTIDVLSNGRAILGLGAGWFEEEAEGLGIPLPPTLTERFERLEETLQIAHQMWSGGTAPFEGKHYRLANPINVPPPLCRPHPPILIGGSGETKTLRLVARYADAWNMVLGSPSADGGFGVVSRAEATYEEWLENVGRLASRKLDVLRQHCDTAGRPFDAIDKSVATYIRFGQGGMPPSETARLCRDLVELGFDWVILGGPGCDAESVAALGREVT